MPLTIRPQPGPQERFLSSPADIVIYGGARGGGKSYAALLEPLRHINNSGFNCVAFRRTYPQIMNPGGLWDKSMGIYPHLGAIAKQAKMEWTFPSGATVSFRHLKLEEHKIAWQGLEVCLLIWEELTHFSFSQFIFLMGSNRSTCGVRPYIRATCNPDAESWVRDLIAPWLDDEGYAIASRCGELEYFVIENETVVWVDESYRDSLGLPPISITYISADVWDNPALLATNPEYLRNLQAQSEVDRLRFLGIRGRGGNWNIKPSAGKVFKPQWFVYCDRLPVLRKSRRVRFWDFAATEQQQRGDDPDRTASCLMEMDDNGCCHILDVTAEYLTPAGVERRMMNCASQDGRGTAIAWFTDPGQAGQSQTWTLRKQFTGYDAAGVIDRLGKYGRAKPLSRAMEFEEVRCLQGAWNPMFQSELSAFPDGAHDDMVDAASGAYNYLSGAYDLKIKTGSYKA